MATQQDKTTSASGRSQQAESSPGQAQGARQMTRAQQGGRLAQSEHTQPYFPSPAELFSNPFSAMRRMHEDMDRIFAQAFGGMGSGLMGSDSSTGSGGGLTAWSPAIEVRQQDNKLTVCAELPGLKPEEVQVEVNEDALVIQGERRQEETSGEGGTHRTERRYGRFYRTIPLPEGADAEQARADFRHGVLEVTIPLPQQQSRRRQIPIGGAGPTGGAQETGSSSTPEKNR